MDAVAIFKSIELWDGYHLMMAYNDTFATFRSHTLCGKLPKTEKIILRRLIKTCKQWPPPGLLMFESIEKGVTDSYLTTSCYHIYNVYKESWIVEPPDLPTINGIEVFPSVAEIILADIVMKRTDATVVWPVPHTWSSAERYIMDRTVNEDDELFVNLVGSISGTILTINEVSRIFALVSRLIHTADIVRIFENALLRRVDASFTEIVECISSRRLIGKNITLFRDIPMGFADITLS